MRIHHLAMRTHDLARLESFYVETLGLAVARRTERSVWLRLGPPNTNTDTDTNTATATDTATASDPAPDAVGSVRLPLAVLMLERAEAGEPAIDPESLELVAFAVDPLERERLRDRVDVEAQTEHTIYFRDPDGRRVGVSSYPLGA